MCEACCALGLESLLKHSEEGKMTILEDLEFTIGQNRKVEDEPKLAHEKMRKMEEPLKNMEESKKNIEDEKIQLELQMADIIDDYKNNLSVKRLKMRRIKKHAIDKQICLQYAFDAFVILFVILIAMIGLFCSLK
jgi:hypothetical protein